MGISSTSYSSESWWIWTIETLSQLSIQHTTFCILRNRVEDWMVPTYGIAGSQFCRFDRVPKNYWRDKDHQREFMDSIQSKLNIKMPQDWGKISQQVFCAEGGRGLIKHYSDSIYKALCSIYPETSWHRQWFRLPFQIFPKQHWDKLSNQRKFLRSIEKQFLISQISQWQRVTMTLLKAKGGSVRLLWILPDSI